MSNASSASDGLAGAAKGTIYNVVGALLTTASGFGTVWLVSNEFGRLGTGALFTAVGLFTILAGATKLGTESSMTWYVSTTNDTKNSPAIAGVVGQAMTNVALLSTAVGGALMAASQPLAELLVDQPDLRGDFQRMLIVLGIALPLWATAQASYGISRGYGTMRVSVVAGSIVRPAALLVTLALLTWQTSSLWALSAAWAVAGGCALVVSLRWVSQRLGFDRRADPAESRRFWTYTRPRAGSDILHAVLERSDLLMLSAIAGTAAAGDYAAANRLVLMGQLVLLAISQALAPFVGRHLSRDETPQAQHLVQTLTTWSVLVTWPPMLVLIINADAVTDLFGEDFANAAPLVQVMAAGLAIMATLGPGDAILLMTGDSRGSLYNHIAALATMVVVALVLIPPFGAMGAAIAWALSRLTMRALSVWRIHRATGMACVDRSVAFGAAIAVVAYVPIGVAWVLVGSGGLTSAIANTALGTVVFVALVFWARSQLALDEFARLVKR